MIKKSIDSILGKSKKKSENQNSLNYKIESFYITEEYPGIEIKKIESSLTDRIIKLFSWGTG